MKKITYYEFKQLEKEQIFYVLKEDGDIVPVKLIGKTENGLYKIFDYKNQRSIYVANYDESYDNKKINNIIFPENENDEATILIDIMKHSS